MFAAFKTEPMKLKTIIHLSDAYRQMIELRTRVLLLPSGIPASYIVPENERTDTLIGAFEADAILGCCVLSGRGSAQVQLRQMAVDDRLQGQRIGAALVAFAEKKAQEMGFTLLYLHARTPVVGFYKKCGYTINGPEFTEAGLQHYRMEKQIA